MSIFQRGFKATKQVTETKEVGFEAEETLVLHVKRCCSCAIFSRSGISIKRNIRPNATLLDTVRCPVDRRIENVSAAVRVPLQPGVRFAAHWSSLSDDEANIFRAVRMHYVVKRDRFPFAISDPPKFNFCRRFPLWGKTVGYLAQILNPMIDQGEGEVLLDGSVCRKERRTNSGHLPVIRSGTDTQINGLSETRERKETN
jgi:hypothetical protein